MLGWIKEKFNRSQEDYDLSCNYNIMITDDVTNTKFSIVDWIKSLDERIQFLEDERIWMKSEIHKIQNQLNESLLDINRLKEENVNLTNSLYEVENSLESKINQVIPQNINLKNFSLGDS